MTNKITKFMTCYIIYWNGKEVEFISFIPMLSAKEKRYRVTRIVILPDFQGLGISSAILNSFGAMYKSINIVITIRTIHPGLGLFFKNSINWMPLSTNNKQIKKESSLTNNRGTVKKEKIKYLGRSAFSYKYIGIKDIDNEIVRINKSIYKNISFNQISLF